MEAIATELSVTIEPGSDPISGRVRLADGSADRFEGYVQLIAAIERIRRQNPTSAEPARRRSGSAP
jgi:hypothetical protein